MVRKFYFSNAKQLDEIRMGHTKMGPQIQVGHIKIYNFRETVFSISSIVQRTR